MNNIHRCLRHSERIHFGIKSFFLLLLIVFLVTSIDALAIDALALDFPAAGWHRGDVSEAQENSRKAIMRALKSNSPNVEVDILDFIDAKGQRVGLLAHDYTMDRITGTKGKFIDYHEISQLPPNSANPNLSPEPFMTVIDLFEIIRKSKEEGIIPIVSLDMKEEGDSGKEFGEWIGRLIKEYGFQEHVFASSFLKSNVTGVKISCPECMTGGLVFNDHWALKYLDYHHTSLDITGLSKVTFFLGFLGKKESPHDFVLIQDDIFFQQPELAEYWRKARKVKFVGVFVYKKERPYSDEELQKLKETDWLELEPVQIQQYLK